MTAIFSVSKPEEISDLRQKIVTHSERTIEQLNALQGSPLSQMARIKFNKIGLHPLEDRPLNFIEQVNQTFTYLVALKAAEFILKRHPGCGGLRLAPGAHAPKGSLDIEGISEGLVGAETFAATHPNSNQKLKKDLEKLGNRVEAHRYAFFASPQYPRTERQETLEKFGVQVWSVTLEGMDLIPKLRSIE